METGEMSDSGNTFKPLTILLVEDDQDECEAFIQYFDSLDDVHLVGVTNNDKIALKYTKDHQPDVVILELELHKGSGSGLSFLLALKMLQLDYIPYILINTNNVSRLTHEQARSLGADFVIVKSQDDYSAENVINFLRALRKTIHDSRNKKRTAKSQLANSPTDLNKKLAIRVPAEIDKIGISPKALGRSYLIDAIIYKLEGKSQLIPVIAKKYKKSAASVERAMQYAINKAWSTTPPDELLRNYTSRIHSEKGVPSPIEFICHYANKLEVIYEKEV